MHRHLLIVFLLAGIASTALAAGDPGDQGCEAVYLRNFSQLDKEMYRNSLGIFGSEAGYAGAASAAATAATVKTVTEVGGNAGLADSAAAAGSAALTAGGATAVVGGTVFGGSLINDYFFKRDLKKGELILQQAKAGGGKELYALQDGLAKENPMFRQDHMSRIQFRQLVLALDEAHRFCTLVVGDTGEEVRSYLGSLSDSQVKTWSNRNLRKQYIDQEVPASAGLQIERATAGAPK